MWPQVIIRTTRGYKMVSDLVKAELKRRLLKWMIPLVPWIGLILLVIILGAGIFKDLSSIGQKGSQRSGQLSLLDGDKESIYKTYEDRSYQDDIQAIQISYHRTPVDPSEDFADFSLEPFVRKSTKDISVSLSEYNYPYRLNWQLLLAADIVTGKASDYKDTKTIDDFYAFFSPVFDYSFDLDGRHFDYYENSYFKRKEEIVSYENDLFIEQVTEFKETVIKKPLPFLKSVKTLFNQVIFSYSPYTVSQSDWNLVVDDTKTYVSYKEDLGGLYTQTSKGYVLYDSLIHSLYAKRYSLVKHKDIIRVYEKSKVTSYIMAKDERENKLYKEVIENGLIASVSPRDEEILLDLALMLPDSYDLRYLASFYNEDLLSRKVQTDYAGYGNYLVSNEPSVYKVPILFAPDSKDKRLQITSFYGPGSLTMEGETKNRYHYGIDIAIEVGTPLIPIGPGKVLKATYSARAGNYIIIEHTDGYISRYLHLGSIFVKEGDLVEEDRVIGLSGNTGYSTGPHLHLGLQNSQGDYMDPMKILPIIRSEQ